MEVIRTENAPSPAGPYSQAIAHGGFLFVSGQIPLDPASGELVGDGVEEQTEQVLKNLAAILHAAGSDWSLVVKLTVYMTDLAEFARFNAVYGRFLSGEKPARAAVQVAGLPLGSRLETDAIAIR